MRFGFWLPVFGGWLRNVEDEQMETSWNYVKRLAQRSEQIGYDLALIAELFLNDIKGKDAPSLDALTTTAALAAVTEHLELMVAVRPTFHRPAIFAKQAANIANISNGRLSLNVVSSWWREEAEKYGIEYEQHDDRYARMEEWVKVVTSMWDQDNVNFEGKYYSASDTILQPKPVVRPPIYAGGESEAGKNLIARVCDGYVMHGDNPEVIAKRIADVKERREKLGLAPMTFGVAGYSIVRSTEQEVKKEIERITNVNASAVGYDNYQQWLSGTQLEKRVSLEDYSVSNRGLRTGLAGTPAQLADRIGEFERAGVDFFLLQSSPQIEEMERFAEAVIR
ncbi:LLM class flavin-dependent oxidoreductase [Aridibaculum aurantiacum]|uniref:LLM class flavin-dependent oxidoreductase n=1 Tax=Aridibaculum aurantiacum TaxID=2810307 RepID=UPI001A957C75|nr:LLM class flavin-dependent oxidoreductase [Aridibaculum aurantiacum]